tara:strand:+ start:688 stop:1032 length:345 start_codon:yes stop_codon:yes gene_type:complete
MYLANHQIIELYDCDRSILEDSNYVRNIFKEAVKESNATVVAEKYHNFNPHGLTGVAVITESHISIHTWPEHRYVAIDVFSCDDKIDHKKILKYLKVHFFSSRTKSKSVKRGKV